MSEDIIQKEAEEAKITPRNSERFLWGLIIGSGVFIVGVVGVLLIGIYRLMWGGMFPMLFAAFFHLPAAKISETYIPYARFQEDITTLGFFFQYQRSKNPEFPMPSLGEVRTDVLTRLMRNAVVEKFAQEHGIVVSSEDVQQASASIFAEMGDEENAKAVLKETYNWSREEYQERVLVPLLLEQKINQYVQGEDSFQKEVQTKAQGVLERLQKGESFETLAREFGEDGTAEKGGDLGYFAKGVMVPEFEQAAFSLPVGKVSDLVKTQFGYHIILVEDVKKKGKEINEVKARHILFRFIDAGAVLEKEFESAKKQVYIPVQI